MKALVTGATGFVGYAVMKRLLAAGFSVKILVRGALPAHLQGIPVEVCQGDLCDEKSLALALAGCDHLFHVAAHYKLWDRDPEVFYRVNVEGTKKLLSLAATQVRKIVYTSSVATIKPSPDGSPVNEDSHATLADMIGHYKRSKYLAEMAVKELAQKGTPVVIVNPSAPIGSYDVKPTPTGQIIVDFLNGKMFGYVHTGLNLVAVEDVAEGHLLAAEKGKVGERYILGGENLYLIEIFRLLEKISGVRAPKFKVPYAVAYTAGYMSELWAGISGKPPAISFDGVRMARKCMFFDSIRSIQQLGYRPSSAEEALRRAVQWFRENHYAR
jgi:dihydroflavonol-4-reductase